MRNLYVSSLPSNYSTEQLVALFAQWQVESARFMEPRSPSGPRDDQHQQQQAGEIGRPDHRGYGFVSFRDEATALQAMHAMIGVLIDGVKIQVRPAKSRAPSGGSGSTTIVHDELTSPPSTPPEMNLAIPMAFAGGDSKTAQAVAAAPNSSDISTTMQFIPIDAAFSGDHSSLANRPTFFASPSGSTSSLSAELFSRPGATAVTAAMPLSQPTATLAIPQPQPQFFSQPYFFPPSMPAQLSQPSQPQPQRQQASWPTVFSTDGMQMFPFVALSPQLQPQQQQQQAHTVVTSGLHDQRQFLTPVQLTTLLQHQLPTTGPSPPTAMASYSYPRPSESGAVAAPASMPPFIFHHGVHPAVGTAAAQTVPMGHTMTYQEVAQAQQPPFFYTGTAVGQQLGGAMQPFVFSSGSHAAAY